MGTAPDLIVCAARTLGFEGDFAVAARGEQIVALGSRRVVLAMRGRDTRVVDVPRGLLCPGLHDAHVHLVAAGVARADLDLHGRDLDAIAAVVRERASTRPVDRWVTGRGFDPELFRGATTTARALLDAAATAWPVLLWSHDHHAVALNTIALVRTGFLPYAPDAAAAYVDRDAGGEPTGILRETAASLAAAQSGDLTDAELADLAVEAAVAMTRAGITAVHDMSGSRHLRVLRALDAARRLPLDVFGTVSPGDAGDVQLRAGGRRLAVTGMKAFLDGALGSRTAHLLEPYEGEPSHRGALVLPATEALAFARAAADAGLASYLHAIGDAAVRTALDVLGDVRRDVGRGGLRHRVEHAQMVHDEDIPRFAALGITASVQPVHIALDAPLVHRHWGARAREAFPLRRLLASGANVAFGSDAPIETFDPIAGLRCATERRGGDGTLLNAEEALSCEQALAAYTSGAARAVGRDRDMGSLCPGAVVSLTLLTEDVIAHPTALADCAVAATIVRGEVAGGGGSA